MSARAGLFRIGGDLESRVTGDAKICKTLVEERKHFCSIHFVEMKLVFNSRESSESNINRGTNVRCFSDFIPLLTGI